MAFATTTFPKFKGTPDMSQSHLSQARFLFIGFAITTVLSSQLMAQSTQVTTEKPIFSSPEEVAVTTLTSQLLSDMAQSSIEALWEPQSRLVRLSRTHKSLVLDRLREGLKTGDEKFRLAIARTFCMVSEGDEGIPVLLELLHKGSTPQIRRVAAIAAGRSANFEDTRTPNALKKALKQEQDESVRIALSQALWRCGMVEEARVVLIETMRNGKQQHVRDEAALILAELGNLVHPEEWRGRRDNELMQELYLKIRSISQYPTDQGERAFQLFGNMEARHLVLDSKLKNGSRLMHELVSYIERAYPDRDKVDLDKLFQEAAKGLVSGLDAYSQYMDESDVQATREMLSQDYAGIGAYIGIRDGFFTVISPIYRGPADKAGLRSMDRILEIDGIKSAELMQTGGMNQLITRLKGQPGTPVRIKFQRRGLRKPQEAVVIRDQIHIQTVFSTMLPQQLAYIRLTRFGEDSTDELQQALKELIRRQGARGLILDLRDNPGGLLRAGVEIADQFLGSNKLIVYSEGLKEFAPRKPFYSTGTTELEKLPLVVLINNGSASASEIVAGALRDHKRATLIGEKTFGKGSVQQIIPLESTQGVTQLRLTVAKYFLPSDACIHEIGILPDVEVKPAEQDEWTQTKLEELRTKHTFQDYVIERFEREKSRFAALAEFDGGSTERWPEFSTLSARLQEYRIAPDAIRQEIRQVARTMVSDDRKVEFACDIQSDRILQRGVFELLHTLKLEPAAHPWYASLPQIFPLAHPSMQHAEAPAAELTRDAQ